ncbi:hypothetical protein [Candidatus Albibeggiatoa sp. nov. BB20]|uniref:DUF7687 domain-containing protein n=1 Tax=Candidatus Albibeggiatoa sp. nov. BB20 TaxID=3162723 RepID=UPI0033654614
MKASSQFSNMPKSFWATVRSISQKVGYTVRGKGIVKIPTIDEVHQAFIDLHLNPEEIKKNDTPTQLAKNLKSYYEYRAEILNNFVEPRLMDADRAKKEFEKLFDALNPSCPIPMNKQKGDKKAPAYFTCIINMIVETKAKNIGCDYDPRELTTVTTNGVPLRTLARRVDGAFPSTVNPTAIWEVKEYYYTTTFGSRVADGVYETLLDGMELEELYEHEKIKVYHCLMIDSHYTWWNCGKSYLCRIIDMIHMGYVDEVLFGYEVIERLPTLVQEWICIINDEKLL